MKRSLENDEFSVECAFHCTEAMEIINMDPTAFKVAIIDIYLPLNNNRTTYSDAGIQLADKIYGVNSTIKFIALTKHDAREIEKKRPGSVPYI